MQIPEPKFVSAGRYIFTKAVTEHYGLIFCYTEWAVIIFCRHCLPVYNGLFLKTFFADLGKSRHTLLLKDCLTTVD